MFPPGLSAFLRSQFGKPSGWFGSTFMAPFLNAANTRLIRATIDLLAPDPDDVVLDIGFGGGYSLTYLAEKVKRGKVVGVDYSPEMVAKAAGLLRERHLQPRVRVRQADVAHLPFRRGMFDKIVSVNAIYYWTDPIESLRQCARVLKSTGELALGFRPPASLRLLTANWDDFSLYDPDQVVDMMEKAGLHVSKVKHTDPEQIWDTVVVIGTPAGRIHHTRRRT